MSSSVPVAVALGSNLGQPLRQLRWASQQLALLAEPGSYRCSPWFRSAPVGGPPGQDDYINGVALLRAHGDAGLFLQRLQRLEHLAGRRPGPRWGPRPLDLDLLWWGEQQATGPHLRLPHPRWRERSFVLAPLAALEPGLRAPGETRTMGQLLQDCPMARPTRLA